MFYLYLIKCNQLPFTLYLFSVPRTLCKVSNASIMVSFYIACYLSLSSGIHMRTPVGLCNHFYNVYCATILLPLMPLLMVTGASTALLRLMHLLLMTPSLLSLPRLRWSSTTCQLSMAASHGLCSKVCQCVVCSVLTAHFVSYRLLCCLLP